MANLTEEIAGIKDEIFSYTILYGMDFLQNHIF